MIRGVGWVSYSILQSSASTWASSSVELFGGQELVAEPVGERLAVAVLPGRARLDERGLDVAR